MTAAVVSAAVMLPYLPHLLPHLAERAEYQFPMSEIQVNSPNEWIPPTLLKEVLQQAELPETVSLLDRNLCRNVARAFEAHPWVRKVESVRITGEPALQALIVFRRPVAFVETAQGVFAVDSEGALLPPDDFSIADTHRLPRIKNVHSAPGEVGQIWNDEVVVAAARLADAICPEGDVEMYWNRFGLTAILPQPRSANEDTIPEGVTFEFSTNTGSLIVWGKAPGSDDLEQPIDQKLKRLEYFFSQVGGLDVRKGPFRVDIRPFEEITLEPLREAVHR